MIAVVVAIPLFPGAAAMTPGAGAASGPSPLHKVLTLDDARRLALSSDERVQQMTEAVAGARADVMNAGSGRLPQLELGGTWTNNIKKPSFFLPADMAAGLGGATSVEMGGDWDLQAAATLTLNLWTAGRLSAAVGATTEAAVATAWQQQVVRDAVVFAVEAGYYGTLLAAEQVEINEQALAASTEALRITQAAFDQGNASRFDLLRARVEHTNREAPAIQARNDLQRAMLQLRRACGLDAGTALELADELDTVAPPAPLNELLAAMRDDSPELKSLAHAAAAQRMSVSLAEAARGPMVQLQGRYALQGQWDDDLFPDSNDAVSSASAALAVSMPVFDGFATKASIRRSKADLRTAELELERVTRDRELSVRQARLELENALTALDGRHEGVALAEEAYRLALVRIDNGLATPLERMDAELALIEARVQLAASLYNCNLAAANLKLAVGGAAASMPATEEN